MSAPAVKLQQKSPPIQCLITDDKVRCKPASMVASRRIRRTHRRLFQPPFLIDHSPMPAPARAALALSALSIFLFERVLFAKPVSTFAGHALATLAPASAARAPEVPTPLLFAVENPPVPFLGSDGQTHLVYELFVTNFSSGEALLERVEVLGDGRAIATLDATALARRLQPAGEREASGTLAPSTQALLFLHVTLPADAPIPKKLSHRVTARITAAPPGKQEMTETGGETAVARRDVVVIAPPLSGARFISADSCCDATRHTRAALPVNGRVSIAQRFAVDWEQLDGEGRIYAGAPKNYTIYNRDVLAVADAPVVSVIDGLPDQPPGKLPSGIAIDAADGNSVVLDLGRGRYALYAHLRAGSIMVKPGDRVKRGQVIAHVGNSGNTLAPHLHFHVMDSPSPLASNGLPYAIDAFTVTGSTGGTAAFERAEAEGSSLAITPMAPERAVKNALPLDQLEIRFGT
jgi:murein DD-endopeptidase MepM/ murein hydrolase activator NlpD